MAVVLGKGTESQASEGTDPAALSEFRIWLDAFGKAAPEVSAEMLQTGIRLAQRRRPALARLIQSDPEQALAEAVPHSLRERLPQQIIAELETPFCGRGDLEVMLCQPPSGQSREVLRGLEMGGRRYRAFVYGRRAQQASKLDLPLHGIAVGELAALHESPLRRKNPGERMGSPSIPARTEGRCPRAGSATGKVAVQVGPETVVLCCEDHAQAFERDLIGREDVPGPYAGSSHAAPGAAASRSWTQGAKTLLLLRVDFSDLPGEPLTEAEAAALIRSAGDFWTANSYGKLTLTGTVTPLLRMPQTAEWYRTQGGSGQLLTDARAAAKALGSSYNTQNFDLDALANERIFAFAAFGMLGMKGLWLNGNFSLRVFAHELGHNLGLEHSNGWIATDGTVIGTGYNGEYGDPFDMMGAAGTAQTHYNAYHKNRLGWLPSAQVGTVNSSGLYRIHAYDQALGKERGALKIPKDSRTYWISFRQEITGNPWLMSGAELHWSPWSGSSGGTQLLNMRPDTQEEQDHPLPIGMTFSDTEAGIHVTPVGKGGTTPESLDLVIHMGAFASNLPPVVTLSAGAQAVGVGESVAFTASASDPDGDSLAYYWEFSDRTLGPNSAAVSKSWSAAGEYVVRCIATDMKGGTASAWAVVTVGAPAARFRITGHVFDEKGRPVEGVLVTTHFGHWAPTDRSGAYVNAGLNQSTGYYLTATKPGYAIEPANFANPIWVYANVEGRDFAADLLAEEDGPPVPGSVPADALYLSRGSFRLDWDSSGADALLLAGRLNPAGMDFAAGGPAVSVSLNGHLLATDTLSPDGRSSGAVPGLALRLSPVTGDYTFSLSGLADLDTGLSDPGPGQSETSTQDLSVSISVDGGGLSPAKTFSGLFRFSCVNRGGAQAQGVFSFKKQRTLSGVFQMLKTTAVEEVGGVSGGHRIDASGLLLAAGAAPTVPSKADPAIVITVGDPSDTGLQTVFSLAGERLISGGDPQRPESTTWTYNPAAGAVPGLKKFSLSNSRRSIALSTNAIPTGLGGAGGGTAVKGPLLIRVQVYTAFDAATPLTFETLLELQRASPASANWKR